MVIITYIKWNSLIWFIVRKTSSPGAEDYGLNLQLEANYKHNVPPPPPPPPKEEERNVYKSNSIDYTYLVPRMLIVC